MQELLKLIGNPDMEKIAEQLQSNPEQALALLGILVSTVLITLGIIALFFVRPAQKEKPEKPGKEEEPKKEWLKTLKTVTYYAIPILVLILISVGLIGSSSNSFCRSCHVMKKEYKSFKASPHNSIGCLACHQEPGPSGFLMEKVRMGKRIFSNLSNRYNRPITAQVNNRSCLRCHKKIQTKASVKHTIKVSHKEFLSKRYKCSDCHSAIAHGKVTPAAKNPSMDKCIICHDGKRASTRCGLCHTQDIGKEPRKVLVGYPKTHLDPPTNCRGCHPIDKCTECHGLEMPHQPDWQVKHPREGFINKEVCRKCHHVNFCRICHPNMPAPHPDNWVETHDDYARNPVYGCGCHQEESYFCTLCHEMRE